MEVEFTSLKVPSLAVWTLEDLNCKLSSIVHKSLVQYSQLFAITFYKHLTSEVEINVLKGTIVNESEGKLFVLKTEKNILDYKKNFGKIVMNWKLINLGQPLQPGIGNIIYDIIDEIDNNFDIFVYDIQKMAVQHHWFKDRQKCRELSESKPKVSNFTKCKVPAKLSEYFSKGINFVPSTRFKDKDILKNVESDKRNKFQKIVL